MIRIMKTKMTMRRFIYFFVFFLLLTLALFFAMNELGSKTVEDSLMASSRNQLSYTESVVQGLLNEASFYGIRFTADNDVRFFQSRSRELNNYNAQMLKNELLEQLSGPLLSSQAIESIGIYWKKEETFIYTGYDSAARDIFRQTERRGWQAIDGSLYYFSVYPYITQPSQPAPVEYLVGVKLKTDYLRSVVGTAVTGENSNAFLLVGDELVISEKMADAGIEAEARAMAVSEPEGIRTFGYTIGRDDYAVLTQYIGPIDSYLVAYTKMSDFMQPLHRNRQVFLLSILVILGIGLVVIFTFYRNFYRNVHLLDKKFRQVELGNYGTRISQNPANEFHNLFSSFNHMVTQIQTLFTSLKIETELRQNAEVKQLQAQINPHFLYNSLFFIMSMARSSPEAVMQMSKHLAEYYRYLTRLDSRSASLESELQLAEHYLSIMALCKTMTYTIRLPSALGSRPIMPLLIQPIVENAIQHGIEASQDASRVSVEVKELEAGALIIVSDDGKGLAPEELRELEERINSDAAPPSRRGIGLWNVNQRLKNAYGHSSRLRLFVNEWGGLSVMAFIDFSRDTGMEDSMLRMRETEE